MNKYDLFEAMGGIDEDLLAVSESRSVRRLPLRRMLITAAAVMLLAMTAAASPTIRSWFLGSEIADITEAAVIRYPVYETAEDGSDSSYNIFGYQQSQGRVDLDLEGIGKTPDTILELRVPTWFESGNGDWEYTRYVLFPDIPFDVYVGTWQRWITENGEKTGQWLLFWQEAINPAAGAYPAGYGQFFIDLGNGAAVEQTTLTIEDQQFQVYIVGPSEIPDLVGFQGHTDVIWSDGEYAYHISAGGMDLDMIAGIIRSIEPIQNPEAYLREARFDSIETYYTLSTVPDGLELTDLQDRQFTAWQLWGDFEMGIELTQNALQSDGSDVDNVDPELTLDDIRDRYPSARFAVESVDGRTVHMVWTDSGSRAYWTFDNSFFSLELSGYPDLTVTELADYVRSVVPTDSFDNPTHE